MKRLFEKQKCNSYWWDGFIGSHITERLLEDNKVTVIDNESTGKIEKYNNIFDLGRFMYLLQIRGRIFYD